MATEGVTSVRTIDTLKSSVDVLSLNNMVNGFIIAHSPATGRPVKFVIIAGYQLSPDRINVDITSPK